MEERNLFCDTQACGKLAEFFALQRSNSKEKSCAQHCSELMRKGLTVFSIAGFNLIATAEDVPVYEARKDEVERALGNIRVLETQFGAELKEAMDLVEEKQRTALEVVQRCFQETTFKLEKLHRDLQTELTSLRDNLDLYMTSKDNSLNELNQRLKASLPTLPRFLRVSFEQFALPLAKSLLGAPHLCCEGLEVLKQSERSQVLSRKSSCLESSRERLQIEALFSFAQDETSRKSYQRALLEVCKAAASPTESLSLLQQAWSLRATGTGFGEIGLSLSALLSLHAGKHQEAEGILRQSYEAELQASEPSVNGMKLLNELGKLYFYSGREDEAEAFCEWSLQNVKTMDAENYWQLLFTLSVSLCSQNTQLLALLEAGRECNEKPSATVVFCRTFVRARVEGTKGRLSEAERLHLEAKALTDAFFPSSMWAAVNLYYLSELSLPSRKEELLREAESVFELAGPYCVLRAVSASSLASLLASQSRVEAEKQFEAASRLFDAAGPQSVQAAKHHAIKGQFYKNAKNLTQAETEYRTAQRLFDSVRPACTEAAQNHANLGALLLNLHRVQEAEESFLAAKAIYSSLGLRNLKTAINLSNLGTLYTLQKRLKEAEEQYQLARAAFEVAAPKAIEAAKNCMRLGTLFGAMERPEEAENLLLQAKDIFAATAPQSILAANTEANLGGMSLKMKKFEEAERHYQHAKALYASVGPTTKEAADNFMNLGILYFQMKRYGEALSSYNEAKKLYEVVAPQSLEAATNLKNLGMLYVTFDCGKSAATPEKKSSSFLKFLHAKRNK